MRFGLALPYNVGHAVPRLCALAEEAGWDGCFRGDVIRDRQDAGAAWWIEDLFGNTEEAVIARIRQGPPLSA